MKSQDYKNHTRIHPVYHYVLTLLVANNVGSCHYQYGPSLLMRERIFFKQSF